MSVLPQYKKLTTRTGILLFLACWGMAWLLVFVLRIAFISVDERDCYARVAVFQKTMEHVQKQLPNTKWEGDLDLARLKSAGLDVIYSTYDPLNHYYFVAETAHGLKVKCNRHEDNPLILRLTGITLLALILFVGTASIGRFTLFKPGS